MDTLTVPATFHSLKQIREFVMETARLAGLDRKASRCLQLGVDEIATNAIEHGYTTTKHDNILRVSADFDAHTVRIIIADRGKPYNPKAPRQLDDFTLPLEQRRPGGLGVYLTQRTIDHLLYERAGDWNRVTFIMNRE